MKSSKIILLIILMTFIFGILGFRGFFSYNAPSFQTVKIYPFQSEEHLPPGTLRCMAMSPVVPTWGFPFEFLYDNYPGICTGWSLLLSPLSLLFDLLFFLLVISIAKKVRTPKIIVEG